MKLLSKKSSPGFAVYRSVFLAPHVSECAHEKGHAAIGALKTRTPFGWRALMCAVSKAHGVSCGGTPGCSGTRMTSRSQRTDERDSECRSVTRVFVEDGGRVPQSLTTTVPISGHQSSAQTAVLIPRLSEHSNLWRQPHQKQESPLPCLVWHYWG